MQWRSNLTRYGIVAKALHWIIVIGIIAQYFLAEAGEDDEGAGPFSAVGLHASIGLLILILAALRLAWRTVDPHPAWPDTMKRRDVVIARSVHVLFYGLLFALPLTGWMLSSTEGDTISFFGLFNVPPIVVGSEDLLEDTHEAMFNVLVGLAALHVLAALKHHFIDRDNVLRSMLMRS
ncbi:MAG TPA: cytochrome b [Steroidobacteraceae bacterium]|nr:cytochrome b [Steroidobacteraceae bacterium]